MAIELRMEPAIKQNQELGQKLTLKQAVSLYFGDFVSTPKGICPECQHQLNEKEIMAGFSENPAEFRTTCPKCKTRFLAHLIITHKGGEKVVEEVAFLCPVQTLDKMRAIKEKRGRLGVKFLAQNDRQLFYNMIRHWGAYDEALKAMADYMAQEHP